MKNTYSILMISLLFFALSCQQYDENEILSDSESGKELKSRTPLEDRDYLFEDELPIYQLQNMPFYLISRSYPTYGKYLTTDSNGNLSYNEKNSSSYQKWIYDPEDKRKQNADDCDDYVYYGLYSFDKAGNKYLGLKLDDAQNRRSNISMIEKTLTYTRHQWRFDRLSKGTNHSGANANYFRLVSGAYEAGAFPYWPKAYLGSNPSNNNQPWIVSTDQAIMFEVLPVENFILNKLTWSIEPEDILTSLPAFIDQATVINNSGATVTMNANFSRKASESSNFSETKGLSLSVTAGGKVGIPLVSSGSINVTQTTSASWQYGTSETQEDSRSYSFGVTLPPNTSVTVKIMVSINKLSATYTGDFIGEISGRLVRLSGRWEGIQAGTIYYEVIDNKSNKVLTSFFGKPTSPIKLNTIPIKK